MNFNKLKFGATIGIIGGGQLGKMMAQSAQKMGYKVVVLDLSEDCPCRYVAHEFIQAKYDDEKALNQLGQKCDVITYEFENISAQQLKLLCEKYNIPQGYQAIQLLQDRLTEKETLKSAGTKVVPFISVKESTDIDKAIETLGYPFIVKTRFGGYDGKGQVLINNEKDLQEGFKLIETSECVAEKYLNIKKEVSLTVTRGNNNQITFFPLQEAEKYLNIKKEVSLTVTRGNNNQITFFPLQENEHRNQILFKTIVPARIDKTAEAKEQVNKIIQSIHFIGTFTVEFFIDSNNQLYVNEIAPRPHNSGHYSIEACDYSQFDTHILAVTGQSLPNSIELLKPAVMMNLLGKDLDLLENEFNEHPEWHLHIYGKSGRKDSRKMGHMTVLTNDVNQTEQDMYAKFEGSN
ncbi:TPA: 5-(carboxyamino)imidazole ribonucleotide synthase [Staphylococcus aureus]|nr:5-(carboxyamino)imidazole ribonucleotide synthase [Staphylococcus aureus]